MSKKDIHRITPTMHLTSYVWYKNNKSIPELSTSYGEKLYRFVRPLDSLYSKLLGRPGIEEMLLERHNLIDKLIIEDIKNNNITQIIELASGLSARGHRLKQEFPHLTYIESDLAPAIELKKSLIAPQDEKHLLLPINIFDTTEEESLETICSSLDSSQNTLILSEGIIGYLSPEQVNTFWQRLSQCLSSFPIGKYYTDYRLDGDAHKQALTKFPKLLLGKFVGGNISYQYHYEADLKESLLKFGFDGQLHQTEAMKQLNTLIIEARASDGVS